MMQQREKTERFETKYIFQNEKANKAAINRQILWGLAKDKEVC